MTNAINHCLSAPLDPRTYGRRFEQWLILETWRQLQYTGSETRLFFWRTNTGAEVDLLVERHGELIGAYEFKSAPEVGGDDFSGLRAFRGEHPEVPLSVVYRGPRPYCTDDIQVIPWRQFVELEH